MEYMTEQDAAPRERDVELFQCDDGTPVGVRIRAIDLKDLLLAGGAIPGAGSSADQSPEERIAGLEAGLASVCRAAVVLPEGFVDSPAWGRLALQHRQKIAEAVATLSGFGAGEDAPQAGAFPPAAQ